MQKLGLNEIREKYLSFFETKGHLRMKSAPLVPKNDPSLLLINAGMAPLKPYFTGKEVPPSKRVTTCQKCIRTPDIERVGKTARHGTFFEMLGNFSFGDYFKHEATAFAWEFVTKVMEMPTDKLYVTVYEEDDEARDIWINEIGVDPSHVVKMGKEDNFWEHGTGPCGPCSEIYFDRGVEHGCGSPDCAVGCECDRFVEFWNLVFTQFDKDEDGNYNRLSNPNIDTGMGLERIAAIMQGVKSLFDVDTVKNITDHVTKISGASYGKDEKTDVSLRVITDHIRSTTFMVCDGVVPSNEGRGYVLRRLLRRAARHGRLLGINGNFLYTVADTVINESCSAYPELSEKRDYIKKIIKIEEERFAETINQGLEILADYIKAAKESGEKTLSGENAFKLYDTYGFPLDLTLEIAAEEGLLVDDKTFDALMQNQRETARNARKDLSSWGEDKALDFGIDDKTEFIGYDTFETEATLLGIVLNGEVVSAAGSGEEVALLFDKTVFYGESGGQVGDKGEIVSKGFKMQVTDCKKLADGKFLHFGEITEGAIEKNAVCTLKIDAESRLATARNHSTTHLLQEALTRVLGNHVAQAGSLVSPEKLRFDFSHFEALTKEEIAKVENIVNEAILSAMEVDIKTLPIDEAKKLGAKALFGEKYGDVVRVVKMGDFSTEFCGGCHIKNTSNAGLFKILSETGVAAGVRRIEGITGSGVLSYLNDMESTIEKTAAALKTSKIDVCDKALSLQDELKASAKTIAELQKKLAEGSLSDVMQSFTEIAGVKVFTAFVEGASSGDLRNLADSIRDKEALSAGALAGGEGDKITFVSFASKDAVNKGVHAGNLVREVAKIAGGSGGGRPDSGQAGGKDASKISDALKVALDVIKNQLGE